MPDPEPVSSVPEARTDHRSVVDATCGTVVSGSVPDRHATDAPGIDERENGTHQRRYRCKGRDSFARVVGCGKVFRDATALDEFITEAVLTRFDSPDIARALTPKEDAAKVDELVKKLAVDLYKQFLSVANGKFPDEEWEARHRLIALEHTK